MGCFNKNKKNKDTAENTVGPELLKVLPQTELPWYRTKHLVLLNLMLLVPLLSSSAVGYDGSMMNGLQTLPQWRNFFNHPPPPLLGAINAVYPVCKILGLVPASTISDKFGRKVPIYIGLVSLVIGPAIQAASINLPMFIVSRGLIGFATVFPQVACPILVSELSYPTHRGKMTALYNTFFYFGAIAAAWITYGTFKMQSTWAWRCPSALQAAIPFLQLMFIYWVPESPRWLIANGKKDQAIAILTKLHAGGQENSPLVEFEITEIENALALERSQESSASWVTLVKTAPMRRRTLIAAILGFFSQWNGIGVVTYYLSLVLDTIGITAAKDQVLINGLLQLFNFAAAVFAGALMVDRFGRRRLFLVATSGLCLSYVAWTALTSYFIRSHDEAAGRTVVAFIFIAFFFYDVAWTPLPQAYTIEIFPFLTRSRGLTTALTSSYIGLISAQLINPVGLAALGWRYYIVFCCILACLVVVIYFLFPETKGRSLEQITELFEGRSVSVDAEEIISKGKVGVAYEIETQTFNSQFNMFQARLNSTSRALINSQRSSKLSLNLRRFSASPSHLQRLPVQISGQGSGTIQTISVKDKPYTFSTDTYKVIGGQDSHPSPVAYALASLSSCNQVTGALVAKDHGLTLGKWRVLVEGQLPTAVLVGGEQGNPNWESVDLEVNVQTSADDAAFEHFVAEVERRCPITQLFKRSGVAYKSKWINEPL
ncbi:hypothetical protein QWA68_016040 [Fusarium oxysporum]|nr:hypothetical protein QWA68_016040 [Fusarium oxysporum]